MLRPDVGSAVQRCCRVAVLKYMVILRIGFKCVRMCITVDHHRTHEAVELYINGVCKRYGRRHDARRKIMVDGGKKTYFNERCLSESAIYFSTYTLQDERHVSDVETSDTPKAAVAPVSNQK